MKDDVGSVVLALASQADAAVFLIQAVAVVVGLVFIAQALLRLVEASKSGGQHQGPGAVGFSKPLLGIILGSSLINFGFTVSSMVETIFGDTVEYSHIVSYSQQVNYGTGEWKLVIQGMAALVAVFGAYAIFEGFLFWKKCADGNSGEDYFRKGLTHILGGAAAVNIVGTISLLTDTAGVNLSNYF